MTYTIRQIMRWHSDVRPISALTNCIFASAVMYRRSQIYVGQKKSRLPQLIWWRRQLHHTYLPSNSHPQMWYLYSLMNPNCSCDMDTPISVRIFDTGRLELVYRSVTYFYWLLLRLPGRWGGFCPSLVLPHTVSGWLCNSQFFFSFSWKELVSRKPRSWHEQLVSLLKIRSWPCYWLHTSSKLKTKDNYNCSPRISDKDD